MLNKEQIQKNKDEFKEILSKVSSLNQDRAEGITKMLEWLEKTDIYNAPASTRYHQSYEGGLIEHCLQVYKHLVKLVKDYNFNYSEESIIICSLLHDLCKVNTYKLGSRNVKNEQTGQWEKVPEYKNVNSLHMGHAEKSLFATTQFLKLTKDEFQAILFHMGFCDLSSYRSIGEVSEAFNENKLALLLHEADMFSTYLENTGIEEKENE